VPGRGCRRKACRSAPRQAAGSHGESSAHGSCSHSASVAGHGSVAGRQHPMLRASDAPQRSVQATGAPRGVQTQIPISKPVCVP